MVFSLYICLVLSFSCVDRQLSFFIHPELLSTGYEPGVFSFFSSELTSISCTEPFYHFEPFRISIYYFITVIVPSEPLLPAINTSYFDCVLLEPATLSSVGIAAY
jgi:hypothetical protein